MSSVGTNVCGLILVFLAAVVLFAFGSRDITLAVITITRAMAGGGPLALVV
jgi:hypothetical protein